MNGDPFVALAGVLVGGLLTGAFALIVARMNRQSQIDAQTVAHQGAAERERSAELRAAQAHFAAASTEYLEARVKGDDEWVRGFQFKNVPPGQMGNPDLIPGLEKHVETYKELSDVLSKAWNKFND